MRTRWSTLLWFSPDSIRWGGQGGIARNNSGPSLWSFCYQMCCIHIKCNFLFPFTLPMTGKCRAWPCSKRSEINPYRSWVWAFGWCPFLCLPLLITVGCGLLIYSNSELVSPSPRLIDWGKSYRLVVMKNYNARSSPNETYFSIFGIATTRLAVKFWR